MITWILYDITNDRARNKISRICKQAGLYRVQYSCFLGSLSSNEKDSLQLEIDALINHDEDKVYIFRMNREQLKQCAMLG